MTNVVIFDLDGTLLNTIADLAVSANYALKQTGFPTHPVEQYPQFVGNGVNKLIERTLPVEQRNEETVLRLRPHFIEHYNQHFAELTRPYDGIPALLDELHRRGIALAVASNKYHTATQTLIQHYFPSLSFVAVLGQRDGYLPKPDPTIVHDILAAASMDAAQAIYVGDSGVDMQTAANSGVRSIGVTWGFRPRCELEATGAYRLADTPHEIIPIIESLS